jgi:hypothetical protein
MASNRGSARVGMLINRERRVVGDQASPRPYFRREEIGGSDRTPMRFQERLPGRQSLHA